MWERIYEHGRWNGLALNILSTSIEGGKRLQVSEIPYADLPHIKVMGSKARSFKIEVAFVGESSLVNANAFIDSIEATPKGELEHPWLGELPLVYEISSLSINTKRGLVVVSLGFIRAGTTPAITTQTKIRTKERVNQVEAISRRSFSKDVSAMDVHDINQTQNDFYGALNVMVDIVNRLGLAGDKMQSINHAINEAFSAVSGLNAKPDEFASQFSVAVDALASGIQVQPHSASEAVDNARSAQALMLGQIKDSATTHHFNVQMTTAAVKVSKDITELEKVDAFDVTIVGKQPDIIKSDLVNLIVSIDERVRDVTKTSTPVSIELFDSLVALKGHIQAQHDKVVTGTNYDHLIEAPRFKPVLSIAHDEHAKEAVLTSINATQHPLFFRGEIAVRREL